VTDSIKALVFDFDGTLADSMMMVLPVYNQVAARLNLPLMTEADVPTLRRLGPLKAIEAYNVPLWKVPILLTHVRRELEKTGQIPALFSGLTDVFTAPSLAQIPRMILSSNSKMNILRFLDVHSLGTFDHLDCGASLFGKARRLRRLLQVKHLPPQNVLYVGDEIRDIEASREVGAKSVAVSWGYAERDMLVAHGPNYLVDTPAELGQLFAELIGK
jgi:phosphoglycolate phosphatase